jgi:HD-like signal output (HDOD) protein
MDMTKSKGMDSGQYQREPPKNAMEAPVKSANIVEFPAVRKQYIQLIENYIDRMPNLPTTVPKVLSICNSPKSTPNDLSRVISLDPVLAGRVLRVVNSVYYSLPSKVSSLTRAIILLGINTVRNILLSASVLDKLYKKELFQSLRMDEFWRHSFCVAVTAKFLASIRDVPLSEREEYFLAGLLHDLGKIPINMCFSDEYRKTLKLAKLNQKALHRAEDVVLGFDHSVVGKLIAKKWQLSEPLKQTLRYHHEAHRASEENHLLTSIVSLANAYAIVFEIGDSGDYFPEDPVVTNLLEQVGVSWKSLSNFTDSVLDEIQKAEIFLKVS